MDHDVLPVSHQPVVVDHSKDLSVTVQNHLLHLPRDLHPGCRVEYSGVMSRCLLTPLKGRDYGGGGGESSRSSYTGWSFHPVVVITPDLRDEGRCMVEDEIFKPIVKRFLAQHTRKRGYFAQEGQETRVEEGVEGPG